MDERRPLQGADGLRAIATWMVMGHHLCQQLIFRPEIAAPRPVHDAALFFISAGSAGVSVFFVLSGFLLSFPFWQAYGRGDSMPSLRVFAVRRIGRIVPGFWLNLLFFFFIGLVFIPDAPSVIWRYFAGLTFTAGFHWLTFFPAEINGPLWSISFEVFSYLLLPLGMVGLFKILRQRSWTAAMFWWLGMEVVVLVIHGIWQLFPTDEAAKGFQYGFTGLAKFWMPRYNPVGMFGHFALGILAAGLTSRWSRAVSSARRRAWFDILAALFLIAWLVVIISRTNLDQFSLNWAGQPYYFPLFAAVTALLLATLTQSGRMAKAFDNRVTRYTARVSFGLYLWHDALLQAFNGGLSDWGQWLLLVLITFALSYLIAGFSWKWWERPWLQKAHAWKPGQFHTVQEQQAWRRNLALVLIAVVVLPAGLTAVLRPEAWFFPKASKIVAAFRDEAPAIGISGDDQGNLLVVRGGRELDRIGPDRKNTLVYRLPPSPASLKLAWNKAPWWWILPGREPSLSLTSTHGDYLWSSAVGPHGSVALATGHAVLIVDPQGAVERTIPLPFRGDWGVTAVAFSPDGTLWAADSDYVYRLDDTGPQVMINDGVQGRATSLAFSSDGKTLAVCDFGNGPGAASFLLTYPVEGSALGAPHKVRLDQAFSVVSGPENQWIVSAAFLDKLYVVDSKWHVKTVVGPWLGRNTALAQSRSASGETSLFVAAWEGTVSRVALHNGGLP